MLPLEGFFSVCLTSHRLGTPDLRPLRKIAFTRRYYPSDKLSEQYTGYEFRDLLAPKIDASILDQYVIALSK